MSILLPWTRIASASVPRPVLFSGNQEGVLGGPDLPIPRMGDRFAIDIATTQLRQDADARELIASLIEATTADARIYLDHPAVGAPSLTGPSVVVDGAGQGGSTIALRGINPGAAFDRGAFLTIVHAGVGYLHMIRAAGWAAANGKATIAIWPMLRFITVDAEPLDIDRPFIEGRLIGFEARGATFIRARIDPLQFTIQERG